MLCILNDDYVYIWSKMHIYTCVNKNEDAVEILMKDLLTLLSNSTCGEDHYWPCELGS